MTDTSAADPASDPAADVACPPPPAPRWVAPVYLALALALVPWIIFLAVSLPPRQLSHHWRLAWVGIDVAELVALGLTGWLAARRSSWVEVSATATATLLLVDAWFDVTTAGDDWWQALLLALAVELPLAAMSLWIARHAEQVAERTTRLLLRRAEWSSARARRRSLGAP